LYYDPLERVIATLHPNKTYEKVAFDPWCRLLYDANDTVTFDPAEDPDVGAFFRCLPPADYWPTWYAQRIDGALGPQEQDAAREAARHADTPARMHFDVLGRAFRSVADNGRADDGTRRLYATRTVFDIKGAPLAAIDALDRTVVRDDYDMTGGKLRESSMDAGTRWMLRASPRLEQPRLRVADDLRCGAPTVGLVRSRWGSGATRSIFRRGDPLRGNRSGATAREPA
jgi:hypothetical protein